MIHLLLLTAQIASAAPIVFSKPVNEHVLLAELRAAGCKVLAVDSLGGEQRIHLLETVPSCDVQAVIAAHIYVDLDAVHKANEAALDAELAKPEPDPVEVIRLARALAKAKK